MNQYLKLLILLPHLSLSAIKILNIVKTLKCNFLTFSTVKL